MSEITVYPYPSEVATSWRMPDKMDKREAEILRDIQELEHRLVSGTGTRTRRELLVTEDFKGRSRLTMRIVFNLPWDVAYDHLKVYYEMDKPDLSGSRRTVYDKEMKRITENLEEWGAKRGLTDFGEILNLARQTSKAARKARGSTADDHGAPLSMLGDTGLTPGGDSFSSGPFHVEPNEETQTDQWSAERDWVPYLPWAPPVPYHPSAPTDDYMSEMGLHEGGPSMASSSRYVSLPQNPNTMEGNGLSCDPWFDPYQQSQ